MTHGFLDPSEFPEMPELGGSALLSTSLTISSEKSCSEILRKPCAISLKTSENFRAVAPLSVTPLPCSKLPRQRDGSPIAVVVQLLTESIATATYFCLKFVRAIE